MPVYYLLPLLVTKTRVHRLSDRTVQNLAQREGDMKGGGGGRGREGTRGFEWDDDDDDDDGGIKFYDLSRC